MKLYSLFQTLSSLGFILFTHHTLAFQQANWAPGRVIYIHPWLVGASYALAIFAVLAWLLGRRAPDFGRLCDRALPLAAWVLLFGGMVGMALFVPGPYAP